jgi:hypothetical protein
MAPEQAMDSKLTGKASDVFSLGADGHWIQHNQPGVLDQQLQGSAIRAPGLIPIAGFLRRRRQVEPGRSQLRVDRQGSAVLGGCVGGLATTTCRPASRACLTTG